MYLRHFLTDCSHILLEILQAYLQGRLKVLFDFLKISGTVVAQCRKATTSVSVRVLAILSTMWVVSCCNLVISVQKYAFSQTLITWRQKAAFLEHISSAEDGNRYSWVHPSICPSYCSIIWTKINLDHAVSPNGKTKTNFWQCKDVEIQRVSSWASQLSKTT